MATVDQLKAALVNAHNAGDDNAAKILAGEIIKMQQADFPRRAAGLNHQQMVDEYRKTKPGDAWGDYLAGRIQQPMQGETPEQASVRAGGTGSTDRVDMSGTGKAAATFLQGVPFAGEYADEALGTIAGWTGLQDSQTATNAIRGAQADMDQNNWKTAMALRASGGVAGTAVGAGVLPWYTPQSLGGQMLYGGAVGGAGGAAEGAVSGYGSGTDPESRTKNAKSRALISGLVGGVVGTAAPAIAQGVGALWRRGQDWLTLRNEAAAAGMDRPAYEHVIRALEADDAFTPQGAQRLAAGGPEAMLADAGPSTQTLLDAAQQTTGPGTGLTRQRIEGRAGRSADLANNALDNAMGPPRGMMTMQEANRTGTQAARSTAYDAAYNAPINYADPAGQQLEQMFPQIPQDVLRAANRIMVARREPASAQILMRQMPDGSFVPERLPDVRQWDYITRAMNDLAEGGEGRGALGGQTDVGSGFQDWSRQIRRTLRGLVPEYGQALDVASDAIANRQAMDFGARLFDPRTTRDEVRRMMNGLSGAERQNMMAAVRSQFDERLANVTRALTDGNMDAREMMKAVKDFSSRANREKLEALLGPQEARTFFDQFDQAARGIELRANLAQNSRTAVRTRAQREIDDSVNGGVASSFRQGEPVDLAKAFWQRAFGGTKADNLVRSDRVWQQIADALTAPRPQGALTALNTISRVAPRNAATAQAAGAIAGGIGAGAGYQTGVEALTPRQRQQLSNTLSGGR